METNEDKCHLIVSTNQLTEIQIRKFSIKNSSNEKFVGVNIDSKLNFDCHVNYLCNKENNKLRKKIAMNSFLMCNSVSIRHKNILTLPIEMFKVKNKLCLEISSDIFMERTKNRYNLRNHPDFITPQVNSVFHEAESISYLGPKLWDIVPKEFKHKKSLNSFKESIKMWVLINCPYKLSKDCLDRAGFINRI